MEKKRNIIPLIISLVLSVLVISFFVFFILRDRANIIKNGKDFKAKCIDVYTKETKGSNGLISHSGLRKVYVFEVIYPKEIKGVKFEKARSKYHVGLTYKGKYIDNGNIHNIMHNRYEFQIIK